jgi:hypothetical protein
MGYEKMEDDVEEFLDLLPGNLRIRIPVLLRKL